LASKPPASISVIGHPHHSHRNYVEKKKRIEVSLRLARGCRLPEADVHEIRPIQPNPRFAEFRAALMRTPIG